MRKFLVISLVFAALTSPAYAVGIDQRDHELGSALPDGLRNASIERQREEAARSRNNALSMGPRTSSRPPLSTSLERMSESMFPGALGYFEKAGRTVDNWRKFKVFPGTIIEGTGQFSGSLGDGDNNIYIELYKHRFGARQGP